MGYSMPAGRYADTTDLNFNPAAALTASATTNGVELGDKGVGRLTLNVTAASGTSPTLDVTVQCSRDGVTWYDSGTFTQSTGVNTQRKIFLLDRFVRAKYVVAGTSPSFTFTLTGEAV
jgi:hypothetical protein